jgi:hypothetical protein
MHHAEPGRLDPSPNPGPIITFRETGLEQVRDERIHGAAFRGGPGLEPLVEVFVHPRDELSHGAA